MMAHRPVGTSDVDPAILAVLEDLNRGFSQRNVEQVLGLFAPNADIVFIGSEAGETATGTPQLRVLLEALFARSESYRWCWSRRTARMTGPVAWLVADAILRVEGPQELEVPYRMTLVLERCGHQWRIVHYHGSEPAAT